MTDENDIIFKRQTYEVLKALEDRKNDPDNGGETGLNKERVYDRMTGSKQTKVGHLKDLQFFGYVSFSDNAGPHNTRMVYITPKGEKMLLTMKDQHKITGDVSTSPHSNNRDNSASDKHISSLGSLTNKDKFGNAIIHRTLTLDKYSPFEKLEMIAEILTTLKEDNPSFDHFLDEIDDAKSVSADTVLNRYMESLTDDLDNYSIDGIKIIKKLIEDIQPYVPEASKKKLDQLSSYIECLM